MDSNESDSRGASISKDSHAKNEMWRRERTGGMFTKRGLPGLKVAPVQAAETCCLSMIAEFAGFAEARLAGVVFKHKSLRRFFAIVRAESLETQVRQQRLLVMAPNVVGAFDLCAVANWKIGVLRPKLRTLSLDANLADTES